MATESAVLWKCGSCDDCFYDLQMLAGHKCIDNNETGIAETCMKELEVQSYNESDLGNSNDQVQAIGCLTVLEDGDVDDLDHGIGQNSTISLASSSALDAKNSQKPTIISVRGSTDDRKNKRRRKAKRSAVWTYFSALDEKKAICLICNKVIAYCGTPTNLFYHLSRFHPNENEVVKSKQDGGLKYQYLEHKLPKCTALGSPNVKSVDVVSHVSSHKKTNITDRLIEMFTLDLQPVALLQGEGFKKLLTTIDPSFKLPDQKKMLKDLIPRRYYNEYKKVQHQVENSDKVHVSVELWSGFNNEYFVTITGHFVTEQFEYKCYTLNTSRLGNNHTSQNIATALLSCISDWDITSNIMCIVTDGSDDIMKAVCQTGWKHIVCFAHTLNRVIKESLASSPDLTLLLEKCRGIVTFLKHNDAAKQKVMEIQTHNKQVQTHLRQDGDMYDNKNSYYPLKPKKDIPTQWISVFYMLQRIFTLKNVISIVFDTVPSTVDAFSESDWIAIEETISLLKAFEVVTLELCGENFPSLSKVIPMVHGLLSLVNNCNSLTLSSVERVRKELLTQLRKRVGQVEHNVLLAMPTVLDPRFKNIAFQSESAVDGVIQALSVEGCKYITSFSLSLENEQSMEEGASTYTDSLWEGFDKKAKPKKEPVPANEVVTNEIKRYLEEPLIDRKKDPLAWWKEHGSSRFPLLSTIAKQVLSIPATSVPAERVFLSKGQIFSEKRKLIKPKYVNQFLFLNMNIE